MKEDKSMSGKRLWKELRLLVLPGALAAGAVCVFFAASVLETGRERMLLSFLSMPAVIAFFGGVLLVAACPLGREFQHRTLPLLLSQPYPRWSLWLEKLRASALVLLVPGVLVVATQIAPVQNSGFAGFISLAFGSPLTAVEGEPGKFLFGALVFAVTALCSAPLWTLITKSTIGGVAFTGTGQFVAFLITEYACQKLFIHEGLGVALGALLYSGLCLWLGWREFASLEVRETNAAATDFLDDTNAAEERSWLKRITRRGLVLGTGGSRLDRWLRSRPTGSLGNLLRKELRLQKPVYLLGALFTLGWMVVLGLDFLQPQQGYENLFPAVSALYVPLVLLLAGSISLSDENALGTAAWQLTLPTPAARQWRVKFAVSLAAGTMVGWVLPAALTIGSSFVTRGKASPEWLIGDPGVVLLCISGLLFVLSFWAVSLVGNTIRAVLLSLLALVLLPLGVGAGAGTAEWLTGLPAGFFARSDYAFVPPALLLIGLALGQSLRLFKRPTLQQSQLILYPGTLLIAAFGCGFFERCV